MKKYTDSELRYSATSRCKCGTGLAYPKDGSQPDDASVFAMVSDWWCATILKGEAAGTVRHDVYPFSQYEILSEDQPSAQGRTTRPSP